MTLVIYFSDTAHFSYYSVIIPALEESQKIKQQIDLEVKAQLEFLGKRTINRYPTLQEENIYF